MKRITIGVVMSLLLSSCNSNVQKNYIDNLCTDSSEFHVDSSNGSLSYATITNNNYLSIKQLTFPTDTFYFRIYYATPLMRKKLINLESGARVSGGNCGLAILVPE
jgi:hypothetical protein